VFEDQSPGGRGVDASSVAAWTETLATAVLDHDDAARIDLLRALEELKCAAEGLQAAVTADFEASQRRLAAEHGVPAERQGRGIAEQVALARRESPHRGRRHLRLARVLADEMTSIGAALRRGLITEHRAGLLADQTSCLSREDRMIVDAAVASDPRRLAAMGDRQAAAEAAKLAAQLDAASVCERRRRAESERTVTIRPAPDTMTWVTALLPVKEGVALYASLRRAADSARSSGDPRSRGQVMADTLCGRVAAGATPTEPPANPVTLGLVMTDRAVLTDADDPGHLEDYGPIPADLGRELLHHALDRGEAVWLRRLYTSPTTGQLVAMDSRQRLFRHSLRQLIRLRDQVCRTPWCEAPIRDGDHAEEHRSDGATSFANGQGLCRACNLAKQALGWRARPRPGPGHEVETLTPTGHRYRSRAPAVVRPSCVETRPGVWRLVA